MAKARKPRVNRRALASALVLKKYCDDLGIAWDPECVSADLVVDDTKISRAEGKLFAFVADRLRVKFLYSYLNIDGGRSRGYSSRAASVGMGLDDLIDIGRRAGWIGSE